MIPQGLENFTAFITTLGVFATFSAVLYTVDALFTTIKKWRRWE